MRYTNEEIAKRSARRKKINLIFKILIYSVILPITIYNLSLIIMSYIKADETPSFFGIKTYAVISGSMQPELKIGDVIVVKHVSNNELNVGDIISFRKDDSIITHRISEKSINGYTTKGDFNNVEDSGKVKYEDIEGKVIFKIPYIGKIVFAIKNKIFIIITVIMVFLTYMHNLKLKAKKEIRSEKRKNFNIRK